MLIRKFEGESVEKILEKVKREFGSKALVLNTTQKRSGVFQKPRVEITAAIIPDTKDSEEKKIIYHNHFKTPVERMFGNETIKPLAPKKYIEIDDEPHVQKQTSQRQLENRCINLGLSSNCAEEVAYEIFQEFEPSQLREPEGIKRALARVLEGKVQTQGFQQIRNRKWLVIGSEGVGKTTWIIKNCILLHRDKLPFFVHSTNRSKLSAAFENRKIRKLFESSIAKEAATSFKELDFKKELEPHDYDCVVWVIDARLRLYEILKELEAIRKKYVVNAVSFSKIDSVYQKGTLWECLKKTKLPLLGLNAHSSYEKDLVFHNSKSLIDYILHF